jgi:hypothetical protein
MCGRRPHRECVSENWLQQDRHDAALVRTIRAARATDVNILCGQPESLCAHRRTGTGARAQDRLRGISRALSSGRRCAGQRRAPVSLPRRTDRRGTRIRPRPDRLQPKPRALAGVHVCRRRTVSRVLPVAPSGARHAGRARRGNVRASGRDGATSRGRSVRSVRDRGSPRLFRPF